jgi:hypothetical protein
VFERERERESVGVKGVPLVVNALGEIAFPDIYFPLIFVIEKQKLK